MSQPKYIHALDIPVPERKDLDAETRKYFDICDEKLGMVPNVLASYSFDSAKLRAFSDMYGDLMLGDSGLSKLEREMIAVVVSSLNLFRDLFPAACCVFYFDERIYSQEP